MNAFLCFLLVASKHGASHIYEIDIIYGTNVNTYNNYTISSPIGFTQSMCTSVAFCLAATYEFIKFAVFIYFSLLRFQLLVATVAVYTCYGDFFAIIFSQKKIEDNRRLCKNFSF